MAAPPIRATVVLVAAVVAAVAVASPLHLPLNNPNEGVRVYTVKALVEHGTLAIDDVSRAWGFIDDKARRDGRTYQSKAPLPALLAAAAYAVVHPVTGDLDRPTLTRLCRVAGSGLPTALLVALAWWSLRRAQRGQGDTDDADDTTNATSDVVDAVMVGLVLGTGVLSSLQVFSGHAIAAVAPAALLGLARLPRSSTTTHGSWPSVVAGVVFAVAASSEYPAALIAPLVWLVVRRTDNALLHMGLAVVGALVALLPTLVAHTLMWGAPWRTGYSFLDNPHYRPLVEGTFFGIGLPDPAVWATTLFSPELGLFFFSPFLLLGVVGLASTVRRDRDRVASVVVVATVVAFLLFIAGFRGWRGGWSVGPRYIAELAGLFAVFAIDGVARVGLRVGRPILAMLVGLSMLHSGLAGAFFPHLPDVLRAPVGELVLPAIWRGLCPDAVPLALGLAPEAAGLVVVAVVLVPGLVVAARVGRATLGFVALTLIAAVVVEVRLVPIDARRGLEVRRMLDNWRPEAGVPFVADLPRAPTATRLAMDRRREVRAPLACNEPPRPRRRDVGPGSAVMAQVVNDAAAGSLVVVDDALADHIAPAGGAALIVAASDLGALRPLPCDGDIVVVVRAGRPVPRPLEGLVARGPPVSVGEGFVLHRLARSGASP